MSIYIFILGLLFHGGVMLYVIKKDYPKSRIRDFAFGTIAIIIIMLCLSLIFKIWDNICAILYGIMIFIFTYKHNEKEDLQLSILKPNSLDGYILALVFIFYGIIKTLNKYLE